jgi:hypothetical protein
MRNFAVISYRTKHYAARIVGFNAHHQITRMPFAAREMDCTLGARLEAGAASRDGAGETHAQEDRKA